MGNCFYLIDYKNENEFINSKKISSKNYFKKDNDSKSDLESESESDSEYYYKYFFLM
jgi:hypothetical protein